MRRAPRLRMRFGGKVAGDHDRDVEHDVALVADVSDRMLALEFGRVVASGDPQAVTSHPAVLAAYLGEDAEDQSAGGSGTEGDPPVARKAAQL